MTTTMTETDARDLLAGILADIAPEVDLDQIDPAGELQPQLDIDSIDFLRFVDGIAKHTGLPLPEEDYRRWRRSTAQSPTSAAIR